MKTSYSYTNRWLLRTNIYDDKKRKRFVIYRRAAGVRRSTSVRYGNDSKQNAHRLARRIASQLNRCGTQALAKFSFANARKNA